MGFVEVEDERLIDRHGLVLHHAGPHEQIVERRESRSPGKRTKMERERKKSFASVNEARSSVLRSVGPASRLNGAHGAELNSARGNAELVQGGTAGAAV